MKSREIAQNRDFNTDFAIVPKWCAETKSPPGPAVMRQLAAQSHDCLQSSLFSLYMVQVATVFTLPSSVYTWYK
jgi:hypothetical protein